MSFNAGDDPDVNVGTDSDPWLQMILSWGERNVGAGITLTIGGSLISGTVCSEREYFTKVSAQVADAFRAAWPEEDFETLEETITGMGTDRATAEEIPGQRFIHLRNPKIFNGRRFAIDAGEGNYWRGRVDSIQGFQVGMMRESD